MLLKSAQSWFYCFVFVHAWLQDTGYVYIKNYVVEYVCIRDFLLTLSLSPLVRWASVADQIMNQIIVSAGFGSYHKFEKTKALLV